MKLKNHLITVIAILCCLTTACDNSISPEPKEGVIVIANRNWNYTPTSYYDSDGNIYRQEYNFADSSINYAKDYSYNTEGLLSEIRYSDGSQTKISYINNILSKIEGFSSSNELNSYTDFEIMNDTLISGESYFPNDTNEMKNHYYYSQGKLDSISYSVSPPSADFEYKHKRVFEYDDKGNLVTFSNYMNYLNDPHVELNNRTTCHYNSNNKIIQRKHYSRLDQLTSSETYFYNAIGNITEIRELNSRGEIVNFTTYEYSGDESIVLKEIELSVYL